MSHLFRSELTRFRGLIVAFALGHLLLLVAAGTAVDLLTPTPALVAVALLLYGGGGLALGLVQLRPRTRSEQWIYLLHRPLTPLRIFVALAAAGVTALLAVVSLPLLLTVARLDLLSPAGADLRHYTLPAFALLVAVALYFTGCFLATSASRAAFLVLVLPTFFLTRQAEGLWIFVPLLVVAAWLAWLAASAFQPDLSRLPRRPATVAATALPIGYALFLLLSFAVTLGWSLTTIFSEHGVRGLSTFAWNDYFPEGTVPHVSYLDSVAMLRHGLEAASTDLASDRAGDDLSRQLELADVAQLSAPRGVKTPARHQPPFADRGGSFVDRSAEVRWTFSHDRMLYRGVATRTGLAVGWLGLGDAAASADEPFPEVPVAADNRFLVTDRTIYEVEPTASSSIAGSQSAAGSRQTAATPTVVERVTLSAESGERWLGAFAVHRSLAVASSSRALYLFDARALRRDDLGAPAQLEPRARIAYPDGLGEPTRVDVAELVDGHLVSLAFGGLRAERGLQPGRQLIVDVSVDGSVDLLAQRPLGPGVPPWLGARAFVVSPLFQNLHDLAWAALAPSRAERVVLADLTSRELPRSVLLTALLVALASAAATAALAHARRLEATERWAWTALAFALGAPGVFVAAALTRRREAVPQPAAARAPSPSTGTLAVAR